MIKAQSAAVASSSLHAADMICDVSTSAVASLFPFSYGIQNYNCALLLCKLAIIIDFRLNRHVVVSE
jgi:hypothetical protein